MLLRLGTQWADTTTLRLGVQWQGALTLVTDIDAGNCDPATSTVTEGATSDQPIVAVKFRSTAITGTNGNGWIHCLWAVESADGLRPVFRVPRASRHSGSTVRAQSGIMLWTQDFVTFTRAPGRTVVGDTATGYIECQFTDPLPAGRVYVMTHPMKPGNYATTFTADLLSDYPAAVTPTASANASGVFATSPAEVDERAIAIGGNDMYALKLAWGGSTNDGGPKRKLVMYAGLHAAGEQPSWVAFESMVQWMLTDVTAAGIAFRANWDVYLYYNLSPNGIRGGHRRHNFRVGTDPNRDFLAKSLTEISAVTTATAADTGGAADCFLSWHCFYWGIKQFSAASHPAETAKYPEFISILQSVVGADKYDAYGASAITTTDAYYGHNTLGATISYDAEVGTADSTELAWYTEVGEGWARTVAEADAQALFYTPVAAPTLSATSFTARIPSITTTGASTGTQYYVAYPAAETAPTGDQIVSGMAWEHAVAAGNAAAHTDSGVQSFAEVEGLDPGSYRAAFVWFDGTDYSNVEVSEMEEVAPPLDGSSGVQNPTVGSSAITQSHSLSGADAQNDTASQSGAIDLTFTHILTGVHVEQATSSPAEEVSQTHSLGSVSAVCQHTLTAAQITQLHALLGLDSIQWATGQARAIYGATTNAYDKTLRPAEVRMTIRPAEVRMTTHPEDIQEAEFA